MTTETKVDRIVRSVIPSGKGFQVRWIKTGVRKYRILRVITPAWKSLPRFERILRVQAALTSHLTEQEQKDILRVSVLTPNEALRLENLLPSDNGRQISRFVRRVKTRSAAQAR